MTIIDTALHDSLRALKLSGPRSWRHARQSRKVTHGLQSAPRHRHNGAPQHPVASETPMACPYLPRLRGRYCVCWFMWSPSWTSGFEADVVPRSLR